ncbi:leucine-rich repeat protein SHOC-2 [Lingula anatina]|uniref:Leucine-rich repeat protein SHOC-2 n=1 Tax=Lingula anatina TaxID=7574 RepID=A0A1S3JUA8_LINAN|nr:leucine-rich repeat protein SHOC-2 [Lingula anatina]|eukprot:XP_013413908.1 leucine-rich repeat protein SHOC-2 [Lingula anatina]
MHTVAMTVIQHLRCLFFVLAVTHLFSPVVESATNLELSSIFRVCNSWKSFSRSSLDCSMRNLTDVPANAGHMIKLDKMDLSQNDLKQVGLEDFVNIEMKHLNLSHNQIAVVFQRPFRRLRKTLEELNLDRNGFKFIPLAVGTLCNIKRLSLSYNFISDIWLENIMCVTKSIEELDLRGNQLTYLPLSVNSMKRLTRLDLSENRISGVDGLDRLVNLESLNLASNKLQSIPPQIKKLSKLKELNLFDNQIMKIPSAAFAGTQLQMLYFGGQKVAFLSRKALASVQEKLEYINFNSMMITEYPKIITKCKKLKTLEMADNGLSKLPKRSFHRKAQMIKLNLSRNSFEDVPKTINRLSNLQTLDLSFNKIMVLKPGTFSKLKNLRKLVLSNNMILQFSYTAFPEASLSTIRLDLDVHGNLLTSLDECFFKMDYMKIHLGSNPLHCGCSLYELTVKGTVSLGQDFRCMSPPPLLNVTSTDLISSLRETCSTETTTKTDCD